MSETNTERKRSPNLDLRGRVGNFVVGSIIGRYENKNYPGKYSTLIKVEELEGSTKLYDKDKAEEVEVEIEEGDSVFLSESSWLTKLLEKRSTGDRVRITYTGKEPPKKKGYKAAFKYEVEVI